MPINPSNCPVIAPFGRILSRQYAHHYGIGFPLKRIIHLVAHLIVHLEIKQYGPKSEQT